MYTKRMIEMPKYIITCVSKQAMHLCVEAPSREAAENYYHEFHWSESDPAEFWAGDYFAWDFSTCLATTKHLGTPDVHVSADGEPIKE